MQHIAIFICGPKMKATNQGKKYFIIGQAEGNGRFYGPHHAIFRTKFAYQITTNPE